MTKMKTPCCKPLRIIELGIVIVCFSFLFLLRKYDVRYDTVLSKSTLIHLFTTYGSLVMVLGADIFCELLKRPITNVPMVLVLLVGAAFCSSAGIDLLITRFLHSKSNAFRTLPVINLLAAASWFSAVVFIIDAIIVIRFA